MPAGFNSREILTLLGFILFFCRCKNKEKAPAQKGKSRNEVDGLISASARFRLHFPDVPTHVSARFPKLSTNTTPPRGKTVALFHHQFLKGHKKSGQTPVGICPPLLVSYGKHYAARRLSKACRSISSVMLRSSRSLRALQIVFHRGNRYRPLYMVQKYVS